MSEVIDFPASGPLTPGHADRIHAQAFRDLEARLCDCVSMALIAAQIAANVRSENGELIFAVSHVLEMLTKLKADYYAAYEEREPIEP